MEYRTRRLRGTSEDLEHSGLVAEAYYLKLYLVEFLLRRNKDDERRLAAELLDELEIIKASVTSEDEGLLDLLSDQDKARVYMVHKTLKMYNAVLRRVKNGEKPLRAMWCCIDLFECVLHLWGNDLGSAKEALEVRIKSGKLWVKSNITSTAKSGSRSPELYEDHAQIAPVSDARNTKLAKPTSPPRDFAHFNPVTAGSVKDYQINTELPESDDTNFDTAETRNVVDTDANHSETISQPSTDLQDLQDNFSALDVQSKSSETANSETNEKPSSGIPSNNSPIELQPENDGKNSENLRSRTTTEAMKAMMDQTATISEIQKMCRYTISALSYEDLATARSQLTKALSMLDQLNE